VAFLKISIIFEDFRENEAFLINVRAGFSKTAGPLKSIFSGIEAFLK
jgi:hypothetical protein